MTVPVVVAGLAPLVLATACTKACNLVVRAPTPSST